MDLREALTPKTFNSLSFVAVLLWIFVGLAATGIFSELEISEPRFDFDCVVKTGSDKGFIRRKCFDQYQKKINKLGIPPYAFIIVNFSAISIVSLVYSQYVKSTVNRLEGGHEDAEGERRNPRRRRRLFVTYLSQLAAKFALGIIFIVFLETDLFYPGHFPTDFTCRVEKDNDSGDLLTNQTQSTRYKCFSQRATNKTFWINAVTVVNGIFAFFAFVEIVWILSRAKKGRTFMDNRQFYADHLRSNSDQVSSSPGDSGEAEQEMLLEDSGIPREELKLSEAIKKMKDDCLNITEELIDLNQPFGRNPGEGLTPNHLNIDQIYVNVAMHEGRAHHIFAKDRREQLKQYPPDSKNCFYAKPEDVIDKKHKNVLVVGRPGIGKTLLSTIIARMWASGGAFNENQDDKTNVVVVFLMKFRLFTSNLLLSLRELLAKAETVVQLDEAVWDFVINNASRVLFIFDGVDEFSAKEDIAGKDHTCYKNGLEEKMPVSALFNKLARGQLLRGLNIITTTRPTAVPCIADVKFDRTVEILGFTSEKVQEYVEKFTQGVRDAKDKIWGHIKSNMNLFSLCYIPENCFLICSCLLEIISVTDTAYTLPTRMTDIYAMVVKIFFFKHNRQSNAQVSLKDYMYLPFNKLPNDHKKIFKRLGEIAFKGVKQGRLLFESSEVSGLEDCGLLHRLPDVKSRFNEPPKAQYCFTHSTLQEFFASKHLAESLNKTELENFVSKHINDGAWQMVLQFVAGLLEADPETKSSNSDIFIKLLPMSTEEKSEREMMADHSLPETNTLTCWPAEKDKQIALNLSPLFKEAAKTQGSASREKDEEESKPVSEEEDEEIEVTSEESAENQVDDLTSEEEIEITSEDENEYSSSFREMDEGSIVLHRGKVVKEGTQWDLKQVAVHVIFPPDAVPEDRTLTLLRWNPHARCPPLLHHEAIVSDVIELSAVDSPGILHFNEAVTIVIPHCASNLKGYEVVIKTVVDSETNEWDDSVELEDVRTQDDIKGDHAGSGDVQDFLFPVAISKITQCSTFVVVCRLRSHRHTITSQESKLVWPEFPLARISFPQNAVPHDESVEIIVKLQEVSQKLFKNKQILPGPIMRITTPRAVEFLKPVTIQIPLSLGERYRRRDIDLSIVRVRVLFKESSLEEQEWKEITDKLGAPPRFDGNIITFEVTHFSNFWTLVEQFWNKLALRRGFDAVIDQTVKSEINKLDCVPKAASFLAFVPGGTRLREESQLRLYCVPTCKKREVQDDERKDDNVKMADGSSDEPMYFNDKAYMFLSEGIVTAISPERLRTFHVSFQDEPFLKSLQIRVEKRGDLTVSFYRSQEKDVNNRLCELEVPLPPQRADLTDEHKKCFDKVISLPEEGGEDLKHMRDRLLEETKTPSRERLEWLSMKLTLWEPLARRLGFSEGQIIGFHKDNEEWAKKALSMLLRWKQKKGSDATYAVLCAALSHELVGRKDLAEEVIKL